MGRVPTGSVPRRVVRAPVPRPGRHGERCREVPPAQTLRAEATTASLPASERDTERVHQARVASPRKIALGPLERGKVMEESGGMGL